MGLSAMFIAGLAIAAVPEPPAGWLAHEGYGALRWGMSSDEVRQRRPGLETQPMGEELELLFDTKSGFAGQPASLWLLFHRDRLAAAAVILEDSERLRSLGESEVFLALREMIRARFGSPEEASASELPTGWLEKKESLSGEFSLAEEWRTKESTVRLTLDVQLAEGRPVRQRHHLQFASSALLYAIERAGERFTVAGR